MQSSRKELAREVRDPGMSVRGREVTTRTQTLVNVEEERRDHTVLNARRQAKSEVDSRTSTLAAIEKALMRAAIEFLPADVKGGGVKAVRPSDLPG
jgi:hypothetical protein